MKRFAPAALLVLAAATAAGPAHARPGDLDRSFASDGERRLRSGPYFQADALDTDRVGGILVAGTIGSGQWVVRRLHRSGKLDRRFKRVPVHAQPGAYGSPVAIKALPNGGAIVAGNVDVNGDGPDYVALVRLTRTGRPIRSFGDDGFARVRLGGYLSLAAPESVHVARGGAITLAAGAGASASDRRLVVVRLTATGALDPAFGGGDGVAEPDLGGAVHPRGVGVRDDGRVVAVGNASGASLVARLTADGALETTKATSGHEPVFSHVRADGAVSVIARRGASGALLRFGTDGTATTRRVPGGPPFLGLHDPRGGFYVVAGGRLRRTRSNGALDRRFRWRTPTFVSDGEQDSLEYRTAGLAVDRRGAVTLLSSVYEDTRVDYSFLAMHLSRYVGVR